MKCKDLAAILKSVLWVGLIFLFVACENPPPQFLYRAASVYTMEGGVVEAFLVQEGEILDLGDFERLRKTYPKAQLVDYTGKVLVPGFVDSHVHVHEYGQQTLKANVQSAATVEEMVQLLKAFFPNPAPGQWLLGYGWDEGEWASKGYPDRRVLDEAFPNNPVKLQSLHGFAGFYNAKALELAGIDATTPDPEVGRIIRREDGSPSGVMETLAQQLVNQYVPEETLEDAKRAILSGLGKLAAAGITTIHEAGLSKISLQAFLELDEEGKLPIRVYGMLNGNDADMMGEWFARGPLTDPGRMFHVKGIKVFYDGSLGSRTALLYRAYSDNPKAARMTERISIDKIRELANHAAQQGFQLAVHAIGDLGNDRILDVYEEALKGKSLDHRWRLEHAQIVSPGFYERAATSGVWVSMQSSHAVGDSPWAEDRLGPERIAHAYAWRNMLDHGVPFVLNSDLPGEPWEPLETLYFAVTRSDLKGNPPGGWYPQQKITVEEAMLAMTLSGAKSGFMEAFTGSLAKGKKADFVVLAADPWKIDPLKLPTIKVEAVYVNGKRL